MSLLGSRRAPVPRAVIAATLALLALVAAPAASGTPGELDRAFGDGGRVTRQFGLGDHEPSSHALAMVVAPDGRMTVAGTSTDPDNHPAFLVARFTPDGRPDDTFGDGGKVLAQLGAGTLPYSQATAIALAPDGSVVLAGNANDSPGHPALAVIRFLPDGSLDPTFGTGGYTQVQLGSGATQGLAVAVDGSGRVVVAGDTDDGDFRPALAIARFSPDGNLDASFGAQGRSVAQIGDGPDRFSAGTSVAILPGGDLLVGAEASDARGNQQMAVLRYGQDGTIDPTFASRGVARLQMGSGANGFSTVRALAVAPDGGILVAGEATAPGADEQLALARYLPSGQLDAHFGSRGQIRVQLGTGDAPLSTARSLALAERGQILVTGEATDDDGDGTAFVARFSSRGVLDRTFGTLGAARRQFGAGLPGHRFSGGRASAVVAGSRLLVAGYATDAKENDQVFLGRFVGGRRAVGLVDTVQATVVNGKARIPLACVGPPGERCKGRLALTVPHSTAPGSGRKGRAPVVVASVKFRLVTSKTTIVQLALAPIARRRLKKKARVDATWRVVSVDRAGNTSSLVVPFTLVRGR